MSMLRFGCALFAVAVIACAAHGAQAEVTRVEIASRTDVLGGKPFGDTGAYEKIIGKVLFSVDPRHPRNQGIVDLDKAPRDAAGRVAFSADLYVLAPKDAARGNGVALFDILNRGRKNILRDFNRAAAALDPTAEADFGDGFLMRQGYTLVWLGWQFDIPRRNGLMALDAPPARFEVCSSSALAGRRAWRPSCGVKSGRLHPALPFAIVAINQKPREDFAMTRWATLAIGFLAFCSFPVTGPAQAQSGDGWITLFDGKNLDHWQGDGNANFAIDDGSIVAKDKKDAKTTAFLISKEKYKDFQIYAEFWVSDDANSGIFIRCEDPKKPGAKTCYECNIFDTRPDPSYGTGAIVYHAEVDPMPKAGGKWSTMEITAKGRDLSIMFDGKKTASVRSGVHTEGPLALQFGEGVVKFRKVAIKPL